MSSTHEFITSAASSATREGILELQALAGHSQLRLPDEPTQPGVLKPRVSSRSVVDFWRLAGPKMWFAKDPDFDRIFRDRFLAAHEAAARGVLASWANSPNGALALVLLLDQFPRNAFRGTRRMYETDDQARAVAQAAIRRWHDQAFEEGLRLFLYLPFAHSEILADQDRCVALCSKLSAIDLQKAERHRDIIRRFGRFPHRNPILGRQMRPVEQAYLDAGGFAG